MLMKRILMKLSGEALQGKNEEKKKREEKKLRCAQGLPIEKKCCEEEIKERDLYDHKLVNGVAEALIEAKKLGNEIAIVIGAGNIIRGRSCEGMDRTTADRMGMLGTVINCLCLKDALVRAGEEAVVMTSVRMEPFAELYDAFAAKRYLSEGKFVIFGAGLGIPFLSTDTAGAVRAAEIGADVMMMAKAVDFVYNYDPRLEGQVDEPLKKYEKISCSEMLEKKLAVIDETAAAFCRSVGLPVQLFGLEKPEDILKAVKGEKPGTLLTPN